MNGFKVSDDLNICKTEHNIQNLLHRLWRENTSFDEILYYLDDKKCKLALKCIKTFYSNNFERIKIIKHSISVTEKKQSLQCCVTIPVVEKRTVKLLCKDFKLQTADDTPCIQFSVLAIVTFLSFLIQYIHLQTVHFK